MTGAPLINWLRLEDLLARACELEIRAFAQDYPDETFHACCLRFDGCDGSLTPAFGRRADVEAVEREAADHPGFCYRAAELNPAAWRFRDEPRRDPEGYWAAAAPIQARYREFMAADTGEPGSEEEAVAEFFWLRFEYLAESVVRRLVEREACRYLRREPQFLTYCYAAGEHLEELEDRLLRSYPGYNRACMEFVPYPRPGDEPAGVCDGRDCGRSLARAVLVRCTFCQSWLCEACAPNHQHADLRRRQALILG